MKTKYKQCGLCKTLDGCYWSQVSWIPAKYAKVGTVLQLKVDKTEDFWEDGWVVTIVGEEMDEDDIPDWHNARKVHRKRTGDSQPKKSP